MDEIHRIFIGDKLIQSFRESCWYDTATPFQWCLKEHKKIVDRIHSGVQIKIISIDTEYLISDKKEYYMWLKNIFKGGFDKYL